jgi:membrane-associated phospholipid phosphatase
VTGRIAVNAIAVTIVGVSVVFLSYHHVSDVVGGVVLGLLIATLPLPVFRRRGEAA